MSPTIPSQEILQEANRLADVVKTNPEKLKDQIGSATMDQLDALAKAINDKGITVQENTLSTIRERMEQLKQSEKIDEKLTGLESRLNLVRLLGIKAPVAPETTTMYTPIASAMRGVASTMNFDFLKKVPILGTFIETMKKANGRNVERMFNTILVGAEKNPGMFSTMASMVLGPIGSVAGLLKLNTGAQKRLAELDILDAIDAERLLGEQVAFKGIDAVDFQKYKEKLATSNLRELTAKYLKEQRIGAPQSVTLTLSSLLEPPSLDKQNEAKLAVKKTNVLQVWAKSGLMKVTDVRFDASTTQYDNGVLTVNEADLNADGTPMAGKLAALLQQGMSSLPSANAIKVFPSGNTKIDWRDNGTKAVELSDSMPVDMAKLQELVSQGRPNNITTLAIGFNPKNGNTKISLSFEGSKSILYAPNNPDLLAVLAEQIGNLEIPDDDDKPRWNFKNNTFIPITNPLKLVA